MKKVLALALALIMVLAMGVTSFAATITTVEAYGDGNTEFDFTWANFSTWDIDIENVVIARYNYGDFATMIDGHTVSEQLFDVSEPLSSIKVESEKGLIDVSVYKLDDYVKSIEVTQNSGTYGVWDPEDFNDDDPNKWEVTVKTKSSWPFEDFDLQDLLNQYVDDEFPIYNEAGADWNGEEDGWHMDLFFVYFDFPTYGGAKVSMDNYFTLKFRENTTGSDYIATTEKFWFCVYPFAVFEDDVVTYADEDEAMELVDGFPMIDFLIDPFETNDAFDDFYDDVENVWWAINQIDDDYYDEWETTPPTVDNIDMTPYVIEKSSWAEIVGSTLIVGVADGLEVEIGKIVKGQSSISFLFDDEVDDDVQAINEDAELAALLFLDTTNVLDSDFVISYTFEIEDAAKAGDYFLYELVGDELTLVQKVAVGKGDDEVEVEISRKAGDTLGQYYLSDVELATETAPVENEENPNTGASEVAGVAVALAVISLVSAAAVALKK